MKFENETGQERAGTNAEQLDTEVTEIIQPVQGGRVVLPAGVTLDDVSVEGRDLVITLADGTRIVIPDGAVSVPEIVVNGVVVPSETVAQLLAGSEPQPESGLPGSSGNNFAVELVEIQAAFDLGDLLPFTNFGFPAGEEEEVIPFSDEEPEIVIQTPNDPVGSSSAIDSVNEAGLPARGDGEAGEPAGTNESSDSESTSGTILLNATDGLASVTINGVEVSSVGQTISTPLGVLTITAVDLDAGVIEYAYSLADNTLDASISDAFTVAVEDSDGDTATASLTINIVDDAPIAVDDAAAIEAGTLGPVTGNVLDNDVSGADDFAADGAISGVSAGDNTVEPGAAIQGEYGSLTLNEDGSYSYSRDPGTPGGVEDVFEYTVVDSDGSVSTATLTIEIGDAPPTIDDTPDGDPDDPVNGDEGSFVSEAGLGARDGETPGSGEIADGDASNNSDPSETTGATIAFTAADGLGSVSIAGVTLDEGGFPQTIVDDATGALIVTALTFDPATGAGSITYEYTLADNTSGDDTSVSFDLAVTDLDGDTATDTLTILIIDDAPEAKDDAATQPQEDAAITIDVFANDVPGADSVQLDAIEAVDGSLSGSGTLAYNGDGTFTYTPVPGEEGTVTFDYTITDGDGTVSTATVTIELLDDSTPEIGIEQPGVAGSEDVDEAGLPTRGGEPAGSDEASDSETASGTIAIETGNDTVASLVINGVDVTNGGTVTTAKGELVVALNSGFYTYDYTLTDNTLVDPDTDDFSLTVTDSDGDTASTTLTINIIDDVPTAKDDANALGAGEFGPIGGNVLTNDTQGADAALVTGVSGAGGPGVAGDPISGDFGTLTIAADGTYSYTRNPGTPGGVTDTFTYTITDGDGDTSSAELVITITDAPTTLDLPTVGEDGTIVAEDGLAGPPAGSNAASNSELTQGTFNFTAPDGPAVITIGGVTVTTVGQTITGSFGTITIDAIDIGSVTYTYELTTNTDGDSTSDDFVVRVTDQDGDFSEDTLSVAIVDDVPTANADVDSVTEDTALIADGNVLTGAGGIDVNITDGVADVTGADGAAVTAVEFGTTAGTLGTALNGTYGALTLNADGSYSYELDNTNIDVQSLDSTESLTEVYTYTITDGDGDTSTTTLTITINGSDDVVTLNGLDLDPAELTVDEDDLPDGSSPDNAALTQTGSFSITALDGVATLTAGGQTVWTQSGGFVAGQTITTAIGEFEITGFTPTSTDTGGDVIEATVSFSYVLSDNTLAHTAAGQDTILESFAIEALDSDGSSGTGSLDVLVIDDVPDVTAATATAPTLVTDDTDISGGASATANFAALFDTVFGADGPAASDATVYALSINGGDGTDSGLDDTLTGENILLRLNGDTIEGYLETSGDIAFTLALDPATGDITQTQLRAIAHDDPSDSEESSVSGAAETLDANLVSLTATVTDGDGDQDSETLDISSSFAFEDDGPLFSSTVFALSFDEDDLPGGNDDAAAGDGPGLTAKVFSYSVNFGADGANADEITVDFVSAQGINPAIGALSLTSVGEAVSFDWNAGTNTLTGFTTDIGDPALTMVFDVVAGTVTIEYLKPLDHPSTDADGANDGPETAFEDDIQLRFNVAITDGDGDTSSQPLFLTIDDDSPVAVTDTASQSTENNAFTIDALANDAFGADGVDTSNVASVVIATQATQGVVTYDPGTGLFTYTPNAGAGSNGNTTDFFEYTITDGDGDASTARVDVTLQPDSEPSGGDVAAAVDDDGLTGGNPASSTGDLDANAGDDPADTSEASFTGTLSFDVGNDSPASISFAAALNGATAAIGTETVTYTVVGDLLTATVTGGVRDGADLFTVEITDPAIGAYVVTLLENVLHEAGNDENDATTTIEFTVADSEGDTAAANLAITFDDDGPTASDNSASVTEGSATGGNVLTDDDGNGVDVPGADGYGLQTAIIRIDSANEGTTQAIVDGAGNLVLAGEFGTLTIDATTGVYSYDSNPNATDADAQDVFTYTIVDGDGDEATATLTIDVTDVSGQVSDNDALVNEAGLPIGSDPTSDSEIDADGQIVVTGVTGTLTYTLLSPADGAFGTLQLDSASGQYTYTLDTPVTDTVNENGANTVNGAESFDYEVRDAFNNLIGTGSIDVSIVDDIPTATDQTNVTVAEDAAAAITGNVLTDGTPDTPGADGASVTSITIGAATTQVPQDGTDAVVVTANGTYTINQDGVWSFDPNPNLDNSAGDIDASFTYTLTDGDGDFDTATQPITIVDGQVPLAGPDITLALDDANLADGSNPAGPDASSDTITFTPGSDDIVSIVFGDISALGGGLSWVRVSDTQITGSDSGRLVVTLDLVVNSNVATVTATLNDNFDDHPTINVADVVDLGDVAVVATDLDGDEASATVSVSVADDLPTIGASAPSADALTVDETDLATNATADFSGLFTPDFNADNPGTLDGYTLGVNAGSTGLVDVATGEAVVLVLNGAVVEGRSETSDDLVFTVSVDAAGTVTLDQLRAVTHADANNPNDAATLAADDLITLSAIATDSDGDTATATASIAGALTFLDDGPSLSSVGLASAVDVDETDGLPQSDTSAASILSFTSDFGADGDGGTTFALVVDDATSDVATAIGDFPITLVQTSATVVTGTFNDGTNDLTAFTVTVNSNGTVTLTQNVALEHLIDGDNSAGEHNDALDLAGKISAIVTITDGDGDTDTATVAIGEALTFLDDGPSVTLSGTQSDLATSDVDLGADTQSFANNFTFDGGEDGTASTVYTLGAAAGTDSGLVDTATGEAVLLSLVGGVVQGRTASSDDLVFTVSVDAAGSVTLNQIRAIDHNLSTGSDGATVSLASDALIQLTATITDNDGDTASQTLDIGSNLSFADDTPVAGANDTVLLDDDALGGNPGGNGDLDPDTSNTSGVLDGDAGNDSGVFAFDLGSTVPAGFQIISDGSDGALIQQDQGSGFVTVVTVTLNAATGAYTVTQNANILHEDDGTNGENDIAFTLNYSLTDGDTDVATSSLVINVDDDTPVAEADEEVIGQVDEDALLNGIEGGPGDVDGGAGTVTDTATGSVASLFSAGADAPLTYGFDTAAAQAYLAGLGLESGGTPLAFVVSGSQIAATAGAGGDAIFTLFVASNGDYLFDLFGPLDHPQAGTEDELSIEFGPILQATDADGDTVNATSNFIIEVDDDTPTAAADDGTVTEGQSATGNVITNDAFGADGADDPAISGVASNNVPGNSATLQPNGDLVIVGEFGTLTLSANGDYDYNVPANTITTGGSEVFTYTIVDNDGDPITATLTIAVSSVELAPDNRDVTVDEAALDTMQDGNDLAAGSVTGSNPASTAETVTGQLNVTGAVDYQLVSFTDNNGEFQLNADGSFTYTLTDPVDGPDADNGANTEDDVETVVYLATDANGNTVQGTINVDIIDDVPSLSGVGLGSSVTVDETDGVGANTGATSAASILNFVPNFGADGEASTEYSLVLNNTITGLQTADGDFPITLNQLTPSVIGGQFDDGNGVQAAFVVTINADGTVFLQQFVALEHLIDGNNNAGEHNDALTLDGLISATVTIADGDGDTDSATVPIGGALTFLDDGPSISLSGTEDSLSTSDVDLGSDSSDFSDNFTVDGGTDGIGSVGYTLLVLPGTDSGLVDTATGETVRLSLNNGVVEGRTETSGDLVFTVNVDANGNVTLNQIRAIDHDLSTGSDGASVSLASDILIELVATVTDNDGDIARQALSIGSNLTFADDVPTTGVNALVQLDDDALSGGNSAGTDDDADAANTSGTLSADLGNDGGQFEFDVSGGAPTGFRYVIDNAGGVLIEQNQSGSVIPNFVTVVTVTLNAATGAYTVTQNANILHPDGQNENNVQFDLTYRVIDGDTDAASGTLSINVDDDTPIALVRTSDGTVDEDNLANGLVDDVSPANGDIAGVAATAVGSVGGLFSVGADTPATYAFDSTAASGLPALTSNGVTVDYNVTATQVIATAGVDPIFKLTLDPDNGDWTFELEGALDHASGDGENATDIVIDFAGLLFLEDADGDRVDSTGAFSVTIDDDSPVANPDTDIAIEGQTVTGNVITGAGTTSGASGADQSGADGFDSPAISGVVSDNVPGNSATLQPSDDLLIVGEFGTLTLSPDGTYSYAVSANSITQNETEVFTYSIADNDGDVVSATLTFTVEDVTLVGVNPIVTVAEEGLDTTIEGNDVAAGSVTGSAPAETTETVTGSVGVNGVTSFGLVGGTPGPGGSLSIVGTFGTLVLQSNGDFTYTLTSPVSTTPSGNDGATTEPGESFTYVAFDASGNSTVGTITVNVIDDVPTAMINSSGDVVTHDETAGNDGDANDADIGAIFDSVTNTGDDPDVSGPIIGGAVRGAVLSSTGTEFGADGIGSVTITLGVPNDGVDSGLNTTAGADILLYKEGDFVVGRVGSQSGEAAFAVTVDNGGNLAVVQYLSLAHPIGGPNSPDEAVSVITGALTASVTATDGDGDENVSTVSIGNLIAFEDDGPSLGSGIDPLTADNDTNAATASAALNFDAGSDGVGSITSLSGTTSGIAVGGEAVIVERDGDKLVAFVDNDGVAGLSIGDTQVFDLTFDLTAGTSGEYVFELFTQIDNGTPGVPLTLNVAFTASDGDGDTVSDNFAVTINDSPFASDDTATTQAITEDFNAAFVLDFSGSVNNSELNLQLTAVKDAAFELFDSTTGIVDIALITFSGNESGIADSIAQGRFSSFAEFAQAVDSLNNQLGGDRIQDGFTDFSAGINTTITELEALIDNNADANNQAFFLSDGNPNRSVQINGNGNANTSNQDLITNSLNAATEAAWQTFVTDNQVNVTAIGIGNGVRDARLQDVDIDGVGAPIRADDFEDLIDTLIDIVTPAIGGNLLANDTASSNGIESFSVTVDGVTYTWDGVNTITASDGSPDILGSVLTETTNFGGVFSLNFETGDYTYDPPEITSPNVEVITYSVRDSDDDVDTATLTIDITAVSEDPNFARNDEVITNNSGSVAIQDAWLLGNDGDGVSIAGVSDAFSGTVSRSGTATTFTDTGAATNGSFGYTGTDGSLTNDAFVTVNFEQAGEGELDGTSGDDILVGRNGAGDVIEGDDGADFMIGGTGADEFIINDGDAAAVVTGTGDNGTISGFDTIADFNSDVDDIDFFGTTVVGSGTSGTNGADSTLTIGGQTVKSHAVSNGIITFDDQNNFSSALTLTSESDVAAVVDYLQDNDIGSSNSVVAFVVGSDTYVYFQDNGDASPTEDSLVKLLGVTLTNVSSLVGSAIFPVVLDLDGDGVEFVSIAAGVSYDYNGDGTAEATAWVGADDAILAIDANADGQVTGASEFVFGGDGMSDLEAVAAHYDDNGDGVLDASDSAFEQFGLWQDANQDGVSDPGEFLTLTQAGIASIGLVSDNVDALGAGGDVTVFGSSVFTYANGETGIVADTAFETAPANSGRGNASLRDAANQNDLRQSQTAMVAALSGALLSEPAVDAMADGLQQTGDVSYETSAVETVELVSFAPDFGKSEGDALEGFFAESVEPIDSGLPTDGLSDDSALEPLNEGLSDQPVEPSLNEFSQSDDESSSGVNKPFMLESATSNADQSMEALLAMAEGAPTDVSVGEPTAEASLVLSDVAAEIALDKLIAGFEAEGVTAEFLIADLGETGVSLLDRALETGSYSLAPVSAGENQIDEAAAAAAVAA